MYCCNRDGKWKKFARINIFVEKGRNSILTLAFFLFPGIISITPIECGYKVG